LGVYQAIVNANPGAKRRVFTPSICGAGVSIHFILNTRVEPKNILVVDDYQVVCEALRLMLEMDGHRVTKAGSGPEALAQAKSGDFDLVITDYFLPGMKGDEVAAAIKCRNRSTRVIMLTASPPARHPCHVEIVIQKPCSLERMRGAMEQVFERNW
jgi:CheY-like chemotaxis protein